MKYIFASLFIQMKVLKQLDKLIIKSFIGPYLVSFLVAEFVLVLQFLWKYIDEFVGRGISLWVIVQMVVYYGMTIIPLAVPISILISSVMVYGSISERYELTAFKSAGVSLYRIIRPGLTIAILTALFSLFSSNYLKPKANLKFFQTFDNVRRAKPTLTIEEGIFNADFNGFTIRVGKKDVDGRKISDILVYNQAERNRLNVTTAKNGEMYISEDGRYFTMELYDGVQYSEVVRKGGKKTTAKEQYMRISFKKWIKRFDMGEFSFSFSETNLGRRQHDLFNSWQMVEAIDSLDSEMNKARQRVASNLAYIVGDNGDPEGSEEVQNVYNQSDTGRQAEEKPKQKNAGVVSLSDISRQHANYKKGDEVYKNRVDFQKDTLVLDTMRNFLSTLKSDKWRNVLFQTKSKVQSEREKYRSLIGVLKTKQFSRNKFVLRLHQQLCWALVCIVFMFIGAPLGSIVRKGGFGYPLLIAIAFFIVFIFTSIFGEKLMSSDRINPILGAWMPLVILIPFAIYFTVKAINDSRFEFKLFTWLKR